MNPAPVEQKRVIRPLARDMMQVAAWTSLMMTLVAIVAYPRAQALGAEASFSYWAFIVPQAAGWFLFGMAIYFVAEFMRPYVAMGVSRRRFTAAVALTLSVAAVGIGLYAVLGFLAEGWWYQRVGWEQALNGNGFTAQPGAPFLLGLEVILRGVLLAMSGLLVGWSYQKFNAWLASFLLPLTVLVPSLLVSMFLDDPSELHRIGIDLSDWGRMASTIALLLIAFALYLLVRELLARTPLRARVP